MADSANPRAVIGGNNPPIALVIEETPDFGALISEYVAKKYAEWPDKIGKILDDARDLPQKIENDDDLGRTADVIKKLRDMSRAADSLREGAKTPYRAAGAAVDAFFFPLMEKCQRRSKTQRAGAADILQARHDDYQARKLALEQQRRREEAEKAAEEARQAFKKAEEERIAAEEAQKAAARARKPETVATKATTADEKARAANLAETEARIARDKAEAARIETLSKPSDMVRTRSDGGAVSTMATEPYAVVEDYDKLDKTALWPFIKRDAIDAALRSWARTTGHSTQMAGAAIGRKPKSQIR